MTLPYQFYDAKLTPIDFLVACTLLHLSDTSGEVTATLDELTTLTRVSAETMRRSFRKLEDKGILCTERLRNPRGGYSMNRYRLLIGQAAQ